MLSWDVVLIENSSYSMVKCVSGAIWSFIDGKGCKEKTYLGVGEGFSDLLGKNRVKQT